ncbi:MAG: hypothetical protein ACXU8N_18970 [Telluria sp.]
MRARRLPALLAAASLALCAHAHAGPKDGREGFRFAAIGHTSGDEAKLKDALKDSSEPSLAFVVATGIKGANETCSDKLYAHRRDLFDESARPLMVVLAASDWTECRNSIGRSNAIERLGRLREQFFMDTSSLGRNRLAVTRLSETAKFRSYAENAHWKVGEVLFATVNIPSNNNHYLKAAGRNSEYEDRSVANRAWLHRLFTVAKREHLAALVLFSEADLFPVPPAHPAADDGFAEVRKQLDAAARKFEGKVLLVDTAPLPADAKPALAWRGNVGHLSLGAQAVEIKVTPDGPAFFTVSDPEKSR